MKPAPPLQYVAAAMICASGFTSSPASAEPDFVSRFEGSWTGTGHTRTNVADSSRNVRCQATGSGTQTEISIVGTCTAYGIFSREIGANVTFDPATETYTGVYRGSRAGPSQLSGQRTGDVLTLNIAWPRVINGDERAEMVLRNGADGRFTLEVNDEAPDTGEIVTTTAIEFTRQ